MIKTSPRNVGDLVFSESRKGFSSYHEFKTTAKSLSLTNLSEMKLSGIYLFLVPGYET